MLLRHIGIVLLSALLGSGVGTLVLASVIVGAFNDPFLQPFAAITLLFTIPGAIVLMAVMLWLSAKGFAEKETAGLLVAIGTIAGGAMLGVFGWEAVPWGAMYGCITAIIFVGLVRFLKSYPAGQSMTERYSENSSSSRR